MRAPNLRAFANLLSPRLARADLRARQEHGVVAVPRGERKEGRRVRLRREPVEPRQGHSRKLLTMRWSRLKMSLPTQNYTFGIKMY